MTTSKTDARHHHGLEELEDIREGWERVLPDLDAGSMPLFASMGILSRAYQSFYDKLLGPTGIKLAESYALGLLRSIGSEEPCSPTELARHAGQTTAGMTKTLDRLERAGFVRRRPHPSDRRRAHVLLTKKGAALADRIVRAELEAQRAILQGLSPAKRKKLARDLGEIIERIRSCGLA